MIEKMHTIKHSSSDKPGVYYEFPPSNIDMMDKINEIIDVVNDLEAKIEYLFDRVD